MSTPSSEPGRRPAGRHRRRVDRLARLLADERGTELLAELQKLGLEAGPTGSRPAAGAAPAVAAVGVWWVLPTPSGPELRRRELPAEELRGWADVEHVPAAGEAIRVVLLGESTARGFLLDPVFTPAVALQDRLDAGGAYQVVDLAHVGADARDLTEVASALPALEPDVVVVLAGNNWARPRHTPGSLDLLAGALREGGYPALRRAHAEGVVAPGIERALDALAAVPAARVVVVVPEFNTGGWAPDPELELPPLAPADLRSWTALRRAAETALATGDLAGVRAATTAMTRLDAGTSPVPGRLRALAATDPDEVRTALEESRDAGTGLLTTHTPRLTADVRARLLAGARRRGFDVLDLAPVLRAHPDAPCPDPDLFLDYCHLSARGTATVTAAVADVLTGRPPGTTPPAGLPTPDDSAIADLLAAVHNSYYGQSRERVEELVRRAVKESPAGREFAVALRDLLGSAGPVWTSPTLQVLLRRPHAARYLAPLLSREAGTLGVWGLRAALLAELGPPPTTPPPPTVVDLLRAAEQGLLDGAFRSVTQQPERSFFRAFGVESHFGFALPAANASGRIRVTGRVPAALDPAAPVHVLVNDCPIGTVPAGPGWSAADIVVPPGVLRPGINDLMIRWPTGGADWKNRQLTDARALACGEYPTVLAVQGEVFDILLELDR